MSNWKERLVQKGEKLLRYLDNNSPKILTAIVVGGVVVTSILTVEATVMAIDEINKEKDERIEDAKARADREQKMLGRDWGEAFNEAYQPLTNFDKFSIGWKYYIPPFLSGVTVIASAIGAQKVNTSRQAALAATAEAAQTALKKYQEKTIEQIGKNKEKAIRHELHKEELKSADIPEEYKKRCGAENGEAVFYDSKTGQVFVSTYERVRRAAEKANKALREEQDYYPHGIFIEDCGGKICEFSYDHGILGQGPYRDAIDQEYFLDPHIEEYQGHEITMVYMSYDIVTRERY